MKKALFTFAATLFLAYSISAQHAKASTKVKHIIGEKYKDGIVFWVDDTGGGAYSCPNCQGLQ